MKLEISGISLASFQRLIYPLLTAAKLASITRNVPTSKPFQLCSVGRTKRSSAARSASASGKIAR